jgi:hypothetical protein
MQLLLRNRDGMIWLACTRRLLVTAEQLHHKNARAELMSLSLIHSPSCSSSPISTDKPLKTAAQAPS